MNPFHRLGTCIYRLTIVYLLATCIPCTTYAKNDDRLTPAQIDSLARKLKDISSDTSKVRLLNIIAYAYRRNNPAEGLKYAQEALSLARKIAWEVGIADAYYSLGYNNMARSDYYMALDQFQSALNVYSKQGSTDKIISTSIFIADNYIKLNKYQDAIDYYFRALKIAEKEDRKNEIAQCLIDIGEVFKTSGDLDKALEYFNRGVENCRASGNNVGLAVALRNIGNVFYARGDIDKAFGYYQQAMQTAAIANDQRMVAENLVNISIVYSDKGNNEQALDFAFKALEIYRETDNKSGIGNILGNIGTTFLVAGDEPAASLKAGKYILPTKKANIIKAAGYLQQAIKIEKEIGELAAIPQFYENLAEAYTRLDDYKNAYDAHSQFTLYKDSADSKQRAREVVARNLEYEFAKQKDSIKLQKLLTEQRLAVETRTRKKEQWLYSSGIGVLVIVAIFAFRNLRTQRRLNQTISDLVSEQEKTIKLRTQALQVTNNRLRDLISFNAHQIREPLTRITGTLLIREDVEPQQYFEEFLPQMEKAAKDLDNAVRDVLSRAQGNDESMA